MKEVSHASFGLIIAYLLPGLVGLWGASAFSDTIRLWLSAGSPTPTVGGFLYTTLGSLAVGLTLNVVRWAIIDTLHHRTGVAPPPWNFGELQSKFQAFEALVNYHYRYYQFYGSMAVGLPFAFFAHGAAAGAWPTGNTAVGAGLLLGLEIVFVAASRDALRKYYLRGSQLLTKEPEPERSSSMTNGADHGLESVETTKEKVVPVEKKPPKAIRQETRQTASKKRRAGK